VYDNPMKFFSQSRGFDLAPPAELAAPPAGIAAPAVS
jgi:hypothetical protein